jgi:hypothetical protein
MGGGNTRKQRKFGGTKFMKTYIINGFEQVLATNIGEAIKKAVNDIDRITSIEEQDLTKIKIVWTLSDVLDIAAEMDFEITDEQGCEILLNIEHNHDCNYGVTWDTLKYWVGMYGT